MVLSIGKMQSSLQSHPPHPNNQIPSPFSLNPKHYCSNSAPTHTERPRRPVPIRRATLPTVSSTALERQTLSKRRQSFSVSMPPSERKQCSNPSYCLPSDLQEARKQQEVDKLPRTSGGNSTTQTQRLGGKEVDLEKGVNCNTVKPDDTGTSKTSRKISQTRATETGLSEILPRSTSRLPLRNLASPQKILRAYYEPPVTLKTLAELDLSKFVNNPKLRHDINHDLDLHFRPNFDGKKGAEKKRKAKVYWQALADAFDVCASGGPQDFQVELVRSVFETVREILKTLVPDRDHDALSEVFDVDMLLQQLSRRRYDFVGLANWLSRLLKTHCAPMRDDMVDQMVYQVVLGAKNHDTREFVDGLRRLFGVMEAMKLDIANHQIRSLRHLLVEDTVNFEQRYFLHRIGKREIDVTEAIRWFQLDDLSISGPRSASLEIDRRNVFFSRLLSSIDPSVPIKLPDTTFVFDMDRLYNIQQEMLDLIRLRICHLKYSEHVFGREVDVNHSSFASIRDWTEETLNDVYSTERWTDSAKIVSVEICRKLSNHSLASTVEDQINQGLSPQSSIFEKVKREATQSLDLIARAYTKKYSAFAPGAIASSWDQTKMKSVLPIYWFLIHDLARRVAHIGLLHWQVWAPLVYIKSYEGE